ncbi:MAG: hypothetical protein ACOCUV_01810, partial [bacterium]
VRKVYNSEIDYFNNDKEFLFASGQAVYYILKQSEAYQKSHALIEPFINKSDLDLFKKEIAKGFAKYKHQFSFAKGRFERLMAAIMGYEPEGDGLNVKDNLAVFLTGYFSDSLIFEKKETIIIDNGGNNE